jgi:mevalonate kinase|tara:strand:- start:4 stop:906 length:903 start_codon:yes stop_codon:yes gene_type:complete
MKKYHSHGKLLISGEYLVLKGALALAVPCNRGQSLIYDSSKEKELLWESYDEKGSVWFKATFSIKDFDIIATDQTDIAKRLRSVLKEVRKQNSTFILQKGGRVKTVLEFDRQWGLGTSSTLISNIAQWSNTNPYELLKQTFGGSGYDIACAQAKSPLLFSNKNQTPKAQSCEFNPSFKEQLFFVYLNQKKDSSEAVKRFSNIKITEKQLELFSDLSLKMLKSNELKKFEKLIETHETQLGQILNIKPVKEVLFPDYRGSIKSLGAWGGDFILVTGNDDTISYFKNKGYKTVLKYSEMVIA